MSSEYSVIKQTGKKSQADLTLTTFSGGDDGAMVQLTQGFGMAHDEPGFIQLTYVDTYRVIQQLTQWLKDQSAARMEYFQKLIQENTELERTVFQDAVECERFIAELQVLEIPVLLLKGGQP